MNIQLEKLELIKMLAETNDSDIILSIKKIFANEKKDFWDELSEEQKFEIEEFMPSTFCSLITFSKPVNALAFESKNEY